MAAALVVARYLSFTYTYILEDFEFIIVKNTINKDYTVCRLYYSDIFDLQEGKNLKNTPKNILRHNYCTSICPDKKYALFFNCGEGDSVIIFEPDTFFAKAIEKRIKNDIILN